MHNIMNVRGDEPRKTHVASEMEMSIKAGEVVGQLYDALLKQYKNPSSESSLKSLNKLCVRIVFCLYAEHAGIFGKRLMFHDYLEQFNTRYMHYALRLLFCVLAQKEEERDVYLPNDLAAFPYVDGGLFAGEDIEIPMFTDEIRELLLVKASEDFDWSGISPTIFGAVFESTLNPETRRASGMHYTSIENIHKVIDPLFLDGLKDELEGIAMLKTTKTQNKRLKEFQKKLASLVFLDPAAGSGNFLTETYLSLRRLENRALAIMTHGQMMMGFDGASPIQVGIGQFNGIEINDFAVTVAKTALWIAENQMMRETEDIVLMDLDFLPLKTSANIVEGNALRLDWNDVVDKENLDYIMGNPPFVGFSMMTRSQKDDMQGIFGDVRNLDYVSAWYKKASDYIADTRIECGFVSTNSISQGETVARLWPLLKVRINFAHRSFVWNNEASSQAHVHCVIIGFAGFDRATKTIYSDGRATKAKEINAYLYDAPEILVTSRSQPLCDDIPSMVYGNKPADGGHLIIEKEDYDEFVDKEPQALKYIRPLLGAAEFINNKKRWCLWLVGASPADLRKCPMVLERIAKCKEAREKSIAMGIRKFAATPTLFAQITQPESEDYILVPGHSSQGRTYVPIGFVSSENIVNNAVQIIPGANMYHLGILVSSVHMAWMRAICGRIKSDYRYGKDIVYNNFPWPSPTKKQKQRIELAAQGILAARAKYPDSSLADLYDDLTMPPELCTAHQANDQAVMEAYGFPDKGFLESDCVAELMKMYQKLMAK